MNPDSTHRSEFRGNSELRLSRPSLQSTIRNPSLVAGSSRVTVERRDVLEPFGIVGLWDRVCRYWLFSL
jgi:hypothetical protein